MKLIQSTAYILVGLISVIGIFMSVSIIGGLLAGVFLKVMRLVEAL